MTSSRSDDFRSLFNNEEVNRVLAERRVQDEEGKYYRAFHYDFYGILTFRTLVSDEYARREGVAFINSLIDIWGPSVYGLVAWGEGTAGGRENIHTLLGGWLEKKPKRKRNRAGIDLRALYEKRLARLEEKIMDQWHHGIWRKFQRYNPRLKVPAPLYLPTKHEIELVGDVRAHRS